MNKRTEYFREYMKRPYQKEKRKIYSKNKIQTDIQYKKRKNVGTNLHGLIRGYTKSKILLSDMGCSFEELISHIENQFTEGMTWENWGIKGWHIDHIKPLSMFDLTDRKQYLEAINYKNLRPLWYRENIMRRWQVD